MGLLFPDILIPVRATNREYVLVYQIVQSHRPTPSVYIVFLAIWGTVVVIGGLVAIKNQDFSFPVLWIGIGGGVLSVFALSRVKVLWTEDELVYHSVFSIHRVRFSAVGIATISRPIKGPLNPPYLLVLNSASTGDLLFAINLKLFSRSTWTELRRVLNANHITIT